jgi:hypothetical protein
VALALAALAPLAAISSPQNTVFDHMSDDEFVRALERNERNLDRFRDLVAELKDAAEQSSNAKRQRVIGELQGAMVEEILRVEGVVGEHHVIMQHGEQPRDPEDRLAVGSTTYPSESKKMKEDLKTGGSSRSPALYHLARMQSLYRVCSLARSHAIEKHERGLEAYIQKVEDFADLLEAEVTFMRMLLPEEEEEEVGGRSSKRGRG